MNNNEIIQPRNAVTTSISIIVFRTYILTVFNLVEKNNQYWLVFLYFVDVKAEVVLIRSKVKNWEPDNLITAKNGANKNKLMNAFIYNNKNNDYGKREKSFRDAVPSLMQFMQLMKFHVWTRRPQKTK